MRVEMAVLRHVDGAVERLRARLREQSQRLLGRGELGLHADGRARVTPRCSSASDSGLDAMRTLPDRLEDAELAVELDAVAPEAHHRRRRVELGDEACGVAGRAARQRPLVDQDDVAPACARQVVGHAAARDPAADDDRPGPLAHRSDSLGFAAAVTRKASRRGDRKERCRARRNRMPPR